MSDPRLTPARPDLAALHLKGQIEAARYAEPVERVIGVPIAPLTSRPEPQASLATQLLWGEGFTVYEDAGLWAWGQSVRDGYVGYLPSPCLEPPKRLGTPTHRIAALSAPVYPAPDFKARAEGQLPYGARVSVAEIVPGNQAEYARLHSGGFVAAAHLGEAAPDWVAEAEALLGAPYVWGGRSPLGLDCSALVQLGLQAAGREAPRDADQQEATLGATLAEEAALTRGDLVFWQGHVGLMIDATHLLHANIHHMRVATEPLAEAVARIEAKGEGRPTRLARLDAEAAPG
ncbi:MAG: C40 family peptidase [Pseudomonadota bacterium]